MINKKLKLIFQVSGLFSIAYFAGILIILQEVNILLRIGIVAILGFIHAALFCHWFYDKLIK